MVRCAILDWFADRFVSIFTLIYRYESIYESIYWEAFEFDKFRFEGRALAPRRETSLMDSWEISIRYYFDLIDLGSSIRYFDTIRYESNCCTSLMLGTVYLDKLLLNSHLATTLRWCFSTLSWNGPCILNRWGKLKFQVNCSLNNRYPSTNRIQVS